MWAIDRIWSITPVNTSFSFHSFVVLNLWPSMWNSWGKRSTHTSAFASLCPAFTVECEAPLTAPEWEGMQLLTLNFQLHQFGICRPKAVFCHTSIMSCIFLLHVMNPQTSRFKNCNAGIFLPGTGTWILKDPWLNQGHFCLISSGHHHRLLSSKIWFEHLFDVCFV